MSDHRETCGGIWCLNENQTRVTCGRCQVTTRVEWLHAIDRPALEQLVDPDGVQRAFIDACDLPPRPHPPFTAHDFTYAEAHEEMTARRHPSVFTQQPSSSSGADTKFTWRQQ